MLIKSETHKMLVKKANREDPDQAASSEGVYQTQKQSDLGLPCLSKRLLWQATTVQNFRAVTLPYYYLHL